MRHLFALVLLGIAHAQTCGECPSGQQFGPARCRVRSTTGCEGITGGSTSECSNGDPCTTDANCVGKGRCDTGACVDAFDNRLEWLTCDVDSDCDMCYHLDSIEQPGGGRCIGDEEVETPCTTSSECTACACDSNSGYLEPCIPDPCDVCDVSARLVADPTLVCISNGLEWYLSINVTDERSFLCDEPRNATVLVSLALNTTPVTPLIIQLADSGCTFVNSSLASCLVTTNGGNTSLASGRLTTSQVSNASIARVSYTVVDPADDSVCLPTVTNVSTTPTQACVADCDTCSFSARDVIVDYSCSTTSGLALELSVSVFDDRDNTCGAQSARMLISLRDPMQELPYVPITAANGSCATVNASLVSCDFDSSGGDGFATISTVLTTTFLASAAYELEYVFVDATTGDTCRLGVGSETLAASPACEQTSACEDCSLTTTMSFRNAYTTCANTTTGRTHVFYDFADTRVNTCGQAPRLFSFLLYRQNDPDATILADIADVVVLYDGYEPDSCTVDVDTGTVRCGVDFVTPGENVVVEISFFGATDSVAPPELIVLSHVQDSRNNAQCLGDLPVVTYVPRPRCVRETRVVPTDLRPYARTRCRAVAGIAGVAGSAACGDGDEATCLDDDVPIECLTSNCCGYIEVPPL